MAQASFSTSAAFDTKALRSALGSFLTGVTVVTAFDASGAPVGFTANSFTSVSLEPPLVLVCLSKSASSHACMSNCQSVAINILSADQREVSSRFATKDQDRFAGTDWYTRNGAPVLNGTLCTLDCSIWSRQDVGDHLVLIARVEQFYHEAAARPLGYFRGGYVDLDAEMRMATRTIDAPFQTGALVEHFGNLLLVRPPQSDHWFIPTTLVLKSSRPNGGGLLESLSYFGVQTVFTFVYSIYEGDDGETNLIHRASTDSEVFISRDGYDGRWFSMQELPLDHVADPTHVSILKRYCLERVGERFSIYFNAAGPSRGTGQVAHIDSHPKPWAQTYGSSSSSQLTTK